MTNSSSDLKKKSREEDISEFILIMVIILKINNYMTTHMLYWVLIK